MEEGYLAVAAPALAGTGPRELAELVDTRTALDEEMKCLQAALMD